MKDTEGAALVEAALNGGRSGFEPIVERYQRVVYSLAMRMMNDPDQAADVTQNVFVKVFLNLRSYNPEHKLFSWIYRIAMNEALNASESKQKAPSRITESIASGDSVEQEVEQSDLAVKVQGALLKLRPEHRAPIILTHFDGMSYGEAAEALGIPEKTLKSRLFSARQNLRSILETEGIYEA